MKHLYHYSAKHYEVPNQVETWYGVVSLEKPIENTDDYSALKKAICGVDERPISYKKLIIVSLAKL